jgi:hypothetical protein
LRLLLAALQWINLVAVALGVGGQVFCLLALVPARRKWPPEMAVRVHQEAMTVLPDRYLRPMFTVSLVAGLLIALLERSGWPTLLTVLGVLGNVATAVISYRWEFPINAEINGWGQGPVPDRFPTMRDTWDEKHLWRTTASLVALACFVLAVILRQGRAA